MSSLQFVSLLPAIMDMLVAISTFDLPESKVRPEHLKSASSVTPADGYPDGVSPFGIWDMVGNLPEWLDRYSHKGQTQREHHDPAWFYFMPVFNNEPDPLPGYIGFRPVKDEWEPQLWSGFGAAASEKAFSRVWENDEDAVYDDL